ncbi:hypothetical protein FOB41_15190 [Agrobacterium pusense]|uniref:Uncharacterized protein n=1 Tax=Agrobacterium pusense TaxID=648995 RepID=A0A6H0ZQV8_9HYPH|nr:MULTISPECIES: hypothetical protein [Agrobacterium]QIX22394.1 hypothetical protein FOB41_15190 [Agrobacterium pusense]WCJ62801.1 hypothetical protein G6M15_00945 [Agrobacterium tumefaciens]
MPRPRNPANEAGRAAQERYKAKLDATGGATTDAVDAAISAALALFRHEAETRGQSKNLERIEGIERMAASILVSRGGKPNPVLRAVHLRTRRLDVEELQRLANQPLDDGRPGPSSDLYNMTRP